MSGVNKNGLNLGWLVLIIVSALASFSLIIISLLQGKNIALFNPKGLIAQEQHNLMVYTVTVLMMIAIPTLFVLFFTAWKYRESNTAVRRPTKSHHSKFLVLGMWLAPFAIIFVLASVMWPATHRLAPQKTIAADAKPLTIQVVAMRWKWLFIYPEQKIATVNFIQVPVDTPVTFELTGDEVPMSSFWVPNLGGQLYAMTGHINSLNLIANTPGDYPGSTAEINGRGFAGMRFTVRAGTAANFEKWVYDVKQSPQALDTATYKELLKPSENNPVASYSDFEDNLYAKVVMKYTGTTEGHGHHE